MRHNLGCLEYYAGRLPEAIRLMREADEMDGAGRSGAGPARPGPGACWRSGCSTRPARPSRRALDEARRDGHRLEEADLRLDLATTRDAARRPVDRARRTSTPRWRPSAPAEPTERQRSAALLRASVALAEGVVPRGARPHARAVARRRRDRSHPTSASRRGSTSRPCCCGDGSTTPGMPCRRLAGGCARASPPTCTTASWSRKSLRHKATPSSRGGRSARRCTG